MSDRVRDALLNADVIVLVATARYFQDAAARLEMEVSLRRFAAGEVHVLVVHAADCLLDPRLENVPTVAPEGFAGRNRDQFWRTCAARIEVLCETPHSGRPRYEDEENRAAGEALRIAWWSEVWAERPGSSRLAEHQAELRRSGQLRAGDILGRRFHVRRRLRVAPWATWEGYDFAGQRAVEIHFIASADLQRWTADATEALRQRVAFRHPAIVLVLTSILEEAGLDGGYFVVERFAGTTLSDSVTGGRLHGAKALDALAPIADALSAMHGRRLAHGAIGMEALRVSTTEDRPRCKLVWDVRDTPVSSSAGADHALARQDVAAFARAVLTCLHGATLPEGATASQLRGILHLTDATPELKALLARNLTAGIARESDLTALAALLREAPHSRVRDAAGWFDLEMRAVAGGLMRLGARPDDERAWPSEKPTRSVIVQGFELCVYPVTQRLYELVMGANPSVHVDACAPVHKVSFFDALVFCNQLSVQRGLQPVYVLNGADVVWRTDADGFRLPTESEWEHAAKGDEEGLHPWGNRPPADQVCWNGPGNSLGWRGRKGPSPVWNHPEGATRSGFFDMVGNVWEWCWDWFASFAEWAVDEDEPIFEPIGPSLSRPPPMPRATAGGVYRVLRGGAWNLEDPVALRTTVRSTDLPTVRDPDIGFRVARGAKPLAREIALRPITTGQPTRLVDVERS